MIKVTTQSGTMYIIDEKNKQIKRIPRPGTTFDSILRGFSNVGQFQSYNNFARLEIGQSLMVDYPSEQNWSVSSSITEIDYEFEEEEDD